MQAIKDYYIIGDLHSAALVSKEASINWLCLPHFDSPSVFAKLLDKDAGEFSIDSADYSVSSKYLEDTAIVQFNFRDTNSGFILKDFMVPQQTKSCENHFLVRKFTSVKGISQVKLIFNPKPEYGKHAQKINFDKKLDLKITAGEDSIFLYPPKNSIISRTSSGYQIELELKEGEETWFVMEYVLAGHKPQFKNNDLEKETVIFWQNWVSKGKFFDFCRDKLVRSAVTLKLMQFYPTGAIVAAPTTSLPEDIAGERNWDYRYVWIRDATFTLYALSVLDYKKEAERFFEFIESIVEKCEKENFDVSLMYTIYGNPVPEEKTLKHLSGYKNSKPVRIGNGAKDQFQLDVYGSLIDAYYFASKRHIDLKIPHKDLILKLVKKIKENWQQKDSGIWEFRSSVQHFTYSKVMAWVGADRALRMQDKLKLTEDEIKLCQDLSKEIHAWIWTNCYDPVNKTFRQYPETSRQDATNLLFILLQFLNKHDPLTRTIIQQTCKELSYKNIFVYRYFIEDGLRGKEGAFLLCTFWLISAWAILEDTAKASKLFDKFENNIGQSGLLSEEIDPDSRDYLGNFPQAFSHVGFIMSAHYINKYITRKRELS